MVFLIPLTQLCVLFAYSRSSRLNCIYQFREVAFDNIKHLSYLLFQLDLQILNSIGRSPSSYRTRQKTRIGAAITKLETEYSIGEQVSARKVQRNERCRLNEPFNTRESRERSSDPEISILSRSILDRRTSRLTELENNAPSGGRGMLRGGELFIANYPGLV